MSHRGTIHGRRAFARAGFCALLLLASCGSAEEIPAGPGPETLALPTSFRITSSTSALTSPPSGAPPGGIDYASMVAEGAGLAAESEQLLSFLLSPFQLLKIPVGSTVTTFKSTLTMTNGSGTKSVTLAAAIDFSDFDLDGDGKTEGCSGHTAALPICLRIWLEGERFLAGRLDAFPSAASPGVGRLTVRKPLSMPGGEPGMGVTVIFDHQDPKDISSEMFWGVPSEESGGATIVAVRHVLLTQVGEPASALRTLNLSDQMDVAVPGPHTLRFIVRYLADEDLWSGSVDAQGVFSSMLGLQSFPAVCVELKSGTKVGDEQCAAIGIDAAAVTSVAIANADSVALPVDFPAQPTF